MFDHLYVTGGSGGGVLTSWIVGKTNRFRAAVVAKPVINWYSFVLYADGPAFFYKYWFPEISTVLFSVARHSYNHGGISGTRVVWHEGGKCLSAGASRQRGIFARSLFLRPG